MMTTKRWLMVGWLMVAAVAARGDGEIHDRLAVFRDMNFTVWNPTTTVQSISRTNGGSFAATGQWHYALSAEGVQGRTAWGPVTNITVATGDLVRINWKKPGGVTNFIVWRGATTNLTNWVAIGIATTYVDRGTNVWTNGALSVTATNAPRLMMDPSYTPTGADDVVTLGDVAGLSTSNFLGKSETNIVSGAIDVLGPFSAYSVTMNTSTNASTGSFRSTALGFMNIIETNVTAGFVAGSQNKVQMSSSGSSIGGGVLNEIRTQASYNVIGGGFSNTIEKSTDYATIPGGRNNIVGADPNGSGTLGDKGVALGSFNRVLALDGMALGFGLVVTNFGSIVMGTVYDAAPSGTSVTENASKESQDFTLYARGGARFFTSTNGMTIYDTATGVAFRINSTGLSIGTNSSIVVGADGKLYMPLDMVSLVPRLGSNGSPNVYVWDAGTTNYGALSATNSLFWNGNKVLDAGNATFAYLASLIGLNSASTNHNTNAVFNASQLLNHPIATNSSTTSSMLIQQGDNSLRLYPLVGDISVGATGGVTVAKLNGVNASSYETVAGSAARVTNVIRLVYDVPASNTAAGADGWRVLAGSGSNWTEYQYHVNALGLGTNGWLRKTNDGVWKAVWP